MDQRKQGPMVHFTRMCFKENMKSNGKKKVVCKSKIILSKGFAGSFPITELSLSNRVSYVYSRSSNFTQRYVIDPTIQPNPEILEKAFANYLYLLAVGAYSTSYHRIRTGESCY